MALLDADAATARCAAEGVRGGTYTPHCAAVHPARLVRGLARAVERRGVTIHEGTRVTRIRPGAAV
ncbi:FAD-dependent oxidoreductase, partial [Bacillus mobilis]|uniref:FAD-dependent oxidoreductase n=2 Tax=Bacillati TaxID=1783272 RepID=UPI00398C9A4D